MWPLTGWSLALAVAVLLLALLMVYLANDRYRTFDKLSRMRLVWPFIIVWTMGFAVYDVGMYTGEPLSLLGNVPMAILHAFGIFLLDSDVSAIHNPFHNDWLFMCFFSVTHLAAAIVSMMFVIKHFGFNVIAGLKMTLASLFESNRPQVYVFWTRVRDKD